MCTMNHVNSLSQTCKSKQIEDIIDAKKQNGEYNVTFHSTKSINSPNITCRYAYSTPRATLEDKFAIPDETAIWNIEGDLNSDRDGNIINIGPTDSEITVVRVKRESFQLKEFENNWDMHDKAIPGDGTHLGESPSLVNLVTLVKTSKQCLNTASTKENDEYLVPLSSWDPTDYSREILAVESIQSKNSNNSENNDSEPIDGERSTVTQIEKIEIIKPPFANSRHLNLAARLSAFFRKRFKRYKKSNDKNEA